MSEESPFHRPASNVDDNPQPSIPSCPWPACKYHRKGDYFPRQWNLNDHVNQVHDGVWFYDDQTFASGQSVTDGYSTDDSVENGPRGKPAKPEIVMIPSRFEKAGARSKQKVLKVDDEKEKVTVNRSHLREMESMIRDLQRRVNVCERSSPESPVNSYNSSRRGSIESIVESEPDFHPFRRRPRRRSSVEIIVDDPRLNTPLPPPSSGRLLKGRGFNPPILTPVGGPMPNNGGRRQEIMRWKQFTNSFGDPKWLLDNESTVPDAQHYLNNKPVLTIIREFDANKQFWRRRLDIASPSIIDLLSNLFQYDVDVDSHDGPKGDELHLTEPLMVLFHNRKQLQDKAASVPRQVGEEVQLMCDFLRKEFGDVTEKLDDLESGQPSGLITYPELWLIYSPGTIVYSMENGEHEAFFVDSLRGMQKHQRSSNRFNHGRLDLTCWSINYDGEVYGRTWSIHTIAPFHGTKEISSLDLVPEKFLPNAIETKAKLINRGKQFWGLQGQKFQEYTGEMWSQHNNDEPERVMGKYSSSFPYCWTTY